MSELEKLREEAANQEAARVAREEAARSAHDRIMEPLKEFIGESYDFKVEAWARLLREQGVDPNGNRIGMWEHKHSPLTGRKAVYTYKARFWDRGPLNKQEAELLQLDRSREREAANTAYFLGASLFIALIVAIIAALATWA